VCDLVFLDPSQRLTSEAERSRYLSHNNDPHDPRYQQYLAKVMRPVAEKYPWLALNCGILGSRESTAVEGEGLDSFGGGSAPCAADESHWRRPLHLLDYGCGPTRGIESIWGGPQLQVTSYDPIFFPLSGDGETRCWAENSYDVIVCCEAAEHFYNPASEFERVARLIDRNNGLIVVRTGWRSGSAEAFAQWGYPHDPTHVCFYSLQTMEWIRSHWQVPMAFV